jgi:xanthine dehydrogenase accessory factor
MQFVENVFPFLSQSLQESQRVALVTLVHVDGSSPRPIGSQVGVSESGDAVGMITGGCAEKAIIEEARQSIRAGEDKLVRYGEGSPYLDVVLPCGSAIDLHIAISNADAIVNAVRAFQSDRTPFRLSIEHGELRMQISASTAPSLANQFFARLYIPDYRLFVFGEGVNLVTFANLANTAGYKIVAFTPDEEALEDLEANGIEGRHIFREYGFQNISIDPYTAVITLFHEHDWEQRILHAALNSEADYIGALGSKRTHHARLEMLRALPKTRQSPSVIHGPIGLDIGAQGPDDGFSYCPGGRLLQPFRRGGQTTRHDSRQFSSSRNVAGICRARFSPTSPCYQSPR